MAEFYRASEDPSLNAYMQRIKEFPLLNAGEEVELAQQIEAGMIAERALQTVRAQEDPISESVLQGDWREELLRKRERTQHKTEGPKIRAPEEVEDDYAITETVGRFNGFVEGLVAQDTEDFLINDLDTVAQAGRDAKERFFTSNLRLVKHIADRFPECASMEPLDLISAGNVPGLERAIEKFDFTQSYKFSTYAGNWIAQAIQRARDSTDRIVTLPAAVEAKLRSVSEQTDILRAESGHEPSDEEIAKACDVTVEELWDLRGFDQTVFSYNKLVHESDEDSPEIADATDILADPKATAAFDRMEVLDPALAKKIGNIINVALTDLQRQAFLWSCGIGSPNGDAMTVREISEALGTSRENIYAAHKRALKVIRDTLSGERPLRPPGAIHKPKPKNKDKNK